MDTRLIHSSWLQLEHLLFHTASEGILEWFSSVVGTQRFSWICGQAVSYLGLNEGRVLFQAHSPGFWQASVPHFVSLSSGSPSVLMTWQLTFHSPSCLMMMADFSRSKWFNKQMENTRDTQHRLSFSSNLSIISQSPISCHCYSHNCPSREAEVGIWVFRGPLLDLHGPRLPIFLLPKVFLKVFSMYSNHNSKS